MSTTSSDGSLTSGLEVSRPSRGPTTGHAESNSVEDDKNPHSRKGFRQHARRDSNPQPSDPKSVREDSATSGFTPESCVHLGFSHRLVCVTTGQYRSSRGPAAAQVSTSQDFLSLVSNSARQRGRSRGLHRHHCRPPSGPYQRRRHRTNRTDRSAPEDTCEDHEQRHACLRQRPCRFSGGGARSGPGPRPTTASGSTSPGCRRDSILQTCSRAAE